MQSDAFLLGGSEAHRAMVSVLDSEAHFERKAKEAGITDPNVVVLKNRGFKTLSQVAYMVSQPGVPMPESDFATFCSTHFASFSIGEISSLRRLIFESQTLTVASLRLQVSDPDASSKQKMPEAERDVRLENLKRSLPGITIEGHLEPARCLLDAAARIEASNQIVYLAPEKCVSRLFEVAQAKPTTKQIDVEASKLVIKESSDPVESPTHGAMAVFDAFRRRGLALCFANLIHWPSYERYLNTLFNHLHREAKPGYLRCTIRQLVEADRLCWSRLIEQNVKPRPNPGDPLPLDSKLQATLESYDVSFELMPLPQQPPKRKESWPDRPAKAAKGNTKGPSQGKGKGKSKSASRSLVKIPWGIRSKGGTSETPDGSRICFDYSLGECKLGDGCTKGKHVCAICYGNHRMVDHPKS